MDAATAARMSDPDRNTQFSRRWRDPPDHSATCQQSQKDSLGVIGRALQEAWRRGKRQHRGMKVEGISDG